MGTMMWACLDLGTWRSSETAVRCIQYEWMETAIVLSTIVLRVIDPSSAEQPTPRNTRAASEAFRHRPRTRVVGCDKSTPTPSHSAISRTPIEPPPYDRLDALRATMHDSEKTSLVASLLSIPSFYDEFTTERGMHSQARLGPLP